MNSIMGRQIWALALNVWREAIRDRILYIFTISGIIVMVMSLILGDMTVGGAERIIQNIGFWVFGTWGLIAVMYMGSNIIRKELQQKTVYLILSRPINRPVFLMGKFCGMILVLFTIYSLLVLAWLFLIQSYDIPLTMKHAWAVIFIFGEWILLSALSLFFTSFTTPLLHNFFLVGMTFLGHWSNDLRIFAENAQTIWVKGLLKGIYYVLPNLEALNFRSEALYNQTILPAILANGAVVLIGWVAVALLAANVIFVNRRLL